MGEVVVEQYVVVGLVFEFFYCLEVFELVVFVLQQVGVEWYFVCVVVFDVIFVVCDEYVVVGGFDVCVQYVGSVIWQVNELEVVEQCVFVVVDDVLVQVVVEV